MTPIANAAATYLQILIIRISLVRMLYAELAPKFLGCIFIFNGRHGHPLITLSRIITMAITSKM